MHLGDNKIVMSYISLDKLMFQLEYKLHGWSYFSSIIIVAPPPGSPHPYPSSVADARHI